MTGPAVGRPKSATFRTFDLVGLDVFTHVIKNLYEALPEDEEREMFVVPEVLGKMVQRNLLGNKTKAGFYKKQKGEGDKREIWTLDTATLDYRPSEKVKLPALEMAKNIEDLPERIKALVWSKDRTGAILAPDECLDSLGQVFDVLRHFERRQFHFFRRAIIECRGVERPDLAFVALAF